MGGFAWGHRAADGKEARCWPYRQGCATLPGMTRRLDNRIAIVTGAGQGIGQGIAERLAEEGAALIINDVDAAKAYATVQRILDNGGQAWAFPADVRDKTAMVAMAAQAVEWGGRIDILVNNTGVLRDNYIGKISVEDWDFVLDVNLKGTFLVIQAVEGYMRQQRYGKIVNISSRAFLGNKGQANYSASKAGILGLTRVAALELAPFNVNVNAVAPGLIDTPLIRGLRPDVQEQLIKAQPTPRIGTPRDVANAVLFLVSDEASYITGQVLMVDGGKSLGAKWV